jgi:hypothetical protein
MTAFNETMTYDALGHLVPLFSAGFFFVALHARQALQRYQKTWSSNFSSRETARGVRASIAA